MSDGINSAALGSMIRTLRKGRGMSQAELAAKSGLERTSITNIEIGNQRLGVDKLVKIADALDHDVEFSFVRRRPKWMDTLQTIMANAKDGEELRIPREVIEGIDQEFGLNELLHKGLIKVRGEQTPPAPSSICQKCGTDRLKVPCPSSEPCAYVATGERDVPTFKQPEAVQQNMEEARHEEDTDNWW